MGCAQTMGATLGPRNLPRTPEAGRLCRYRRTLAGCGEVAGWGGKIRPRPIRFPSWAWGDDEGRFKDSDDVGRSLAADRRTKAKTEVKAGQGDKGDRKR